MSAIEIFCCSGGMAEGFRRAGLMFSLAFDKDPNACESYTKNLGHRPIQMDARDLLRLVEEGWRPDGELDLIVADPPCTPWSLSGKRKGLADERDMLVQTCSLIRALKPRAYLIGNVPGLDTSDNWPIVQKLIGYQLGSAGYCVLDYASLNAADFGVPQCRVRPFWYGHRTGPCIRWPEPTHCGEPKQLRIPGLELKPWLTVREALAHLKKKDLGKPIRLTKKNWHDRMTPDKPAHVITGARSRERVRLDPNPHHRVSQKDKPSKVIKCNGGRASQGSSTVEWPWERPATTVTTRGAIPPPGHHPESGSILSLPNAVVLSEKAAAILQGFPDDWHFAGKTKTARWAQIGQAMPPALAEAIACSVLSQLQA